MALVGYTNAGKSTLLNALSDAEVVAADQLFATLDPTTRRVELPSGNQALITDTVGFIQKLPTDLIAAFRATLEEVNEADLLLHVVDVSHPNVDEQVAAVEEVLEELGAGEKTIVTALNKIDRIDPDDTEQLARLERALRDYPNAVAVSALEQVGLDELRSMIDLTLRRQMAPIDVLIPYAQGDLVALVHEHGFVEAEESHGIRHTHRGPLPVELAGRYTDYWHSDR